MNVIFDTYVFAQTKDIEGLPTFVVFFDPICIFETAYSRSESLPRSAKASIQFAPIWKLTDKYVAQWPKGKPAIAN